MASIILPFAGSKDDFFKRLDLRENAQQYYRNIMFSYCVGYMAYQPYWNLCRDTTAQLKLILRNFSIWTEDNILTDILLDYINAHSIERVFDFTGQRSHGAG